MDTKKPKKIVIRRRMVPRFLGVAAAARQLGVSRAAVSSFASGRYRGAIARSKGKLIVVVDDETGEVVKE